MAQMPDYKKRPFKEIFTGANEQGSVFVSELRIHSYL